MRKYLAASPIYPLDMDLLEAVKTVLRARKKGAQSPAFSSADLEAELKQQGITIARGADLKRY